MKLFEKAEPWETVQVDVKFVEIAGRWAFQYTALDDCTRFRGLRLYRRLHQSSSLAFLGELCRAFPFRIRKLQCDNGHEFPFGFSLAVQALGIRHRYTTRKSSGDGTNFLTSLLLLTGSAPGRGGTTTSDSPWLFRAGRRPRS
jgi:hypothetical protein